MQNELHEALDTARAWVETKDRFKHNDTLIIALAYFILDIKNGNIKLTDE